MGRANVKEKMKGMTATIISAVLSFLATVSVSIMGIILYKIQRRDNKADEEDNDRKHIMTALKGLLHQEIIQEGNKYVGRGYITIKQLDEFYVYLYSPYKALEGDGTADETYNTLKELPHTEGGDLP